MSTLDIEGIKALLATHANPSTALHLDAASETNIDEMLRHVKRAAEEAAIPLLAAMVAEVKALRKELKNTRELCAINGEVADDALDEAERLQRERAEWCDRADVLMTEHMTQMRDLTAENAKLRARLVVDDAMVERATFAWLGTAWMRGVVESDPQMAADVRRWLRTALEAALNG